MAEFILLLPVLLFSVVAHEFAHAWVAYRQGDPTAHLLGRITLNPVPHIDPFMSILVPIALWVMSNGTFTFGAARPVPINPRNFRNYKRGDILVSGAGVAMNAVLALASAVAFAVVGVAGGALPEAAGFLATLQRVCSMGITLNLLLVFFNLLPIPPLDGSHLFYHLLPPAWGARYRQVGRFGFLALMLTFMVPGLWTKLLWPVMYLSGVAAVMLRGFVLS